MPCTRLLVAQGCVTVELVVSGPGAERIGDALAGLCFSPVPSWIAVARELVRARAEDAAMHAEAAADVGVAEAFPCAGAAEATPVVAAGAADASLAVRPPLTAAVLEDLELAERAVLADPDAAMAVGETVGELSGVSASELAVEPPTQRPRLRSPGRRVPRRVLGSELLAAAERLGTDVMTTLLVRRPPLVPPTSTLVAAGGESGPLCGTSRPSWRRSASGQVSWRRPLARGGQRLPSAQ